ncbi:MAG: response regulator [Micavibrio sp.]|nr:response regulator [Micavibrio sp.]|tara:strand:+ start:473 stop:1069 length:597 start_codon:yes stop_codon:yes gene_type:complete
MSYQLQSIRVLIVEDNQPMLELAKSILSTFGVGMVYTAKNGEAGFKKYCEINPDLVIADWMMKPMDGISLTRRIRNDPASPNQFVPVILMTGFSEKRRVIQARDAGVTEFLVKPFNARDLYRRISQVIERPRQFVRSEDFFGPDRRRIRTTAYDGPHRRETDSQRPDSGPPRVDYSSVPHKKLEDTIQHISKNNDSDL